MARCSTSLAHQHNLYSLAATSASHLSAMPQAQQLQRLLLSPQQAHLICQLVQALDLTLSRLAQGGARGGGPSGSTTQGMDPDPDLMSQALLWSAAPGPGPPPLLRDVASEACIRLTAAVNSAASLVASSSEACRSGFSAPDLRDESEAVASAQADLALAMAPVTGALLQGLVRLRLCALSRATRDPTTCSALAAVFVQAGLQLPPLPALGGDARGGAGTSPGPPLAQLLAAAVAQFQGVVGGLMRVEPSSVPPGLEAAAAWLRASCRLRNQMSYTCSFWSALSAASAAQLLLLLGQRAAAVQLVLGVLQREVERVVSMVQRGLNQLNGAKVCAFEWGVPRDLCRSTVWGTPGRGLPSGSGLGLSRCLGPGECLHSFTVWGGVCA